MGRPKGSKNRPKETATPETKPTKVKYTVTALVEVKFDITLPYGTDPHQHFKVNKDELMKKTKAGKLELDTVQVKRYEW